MINQFSHEQFISPFSWRYGSVEIRQIWSEHHKRYLWRKIWVELARAQAKAGIIQSQQAEDLAANVDRIDIARAHEIEDRIHHDLMSEVQAFAEQCSIGGGIIHLGATSADIEDNADALRIRESLDIILTKLTELLLAFAEQIEHYAGHTAMAFTHLQPAEPTTTGYRLALYAQDALADLQGLRAVRAGIYGKGLKGAVGTAASYIDLLTGTTSSHAQMEQQVMAALNLPSVLIASQTYPRKQDWQVISALAGLAGSIYKFAFDLRILQSPVIGEWHEPFGRQQVGSSAMPFKRNPVNAEKLDSLGRLVQSLTQVAWDNSSHSLLERTLDDSANRREILPVAFLAVDEMLGVSLRLVKGLRVDEAAVQRNLARYGVFSAVERVLMAVSKAGANRQEMHEYLRECSLRAWQAVEQGLPNPLAEELASSDVLAQYIPRKAVLPLLEIQNYVGDAPSRARELAAQIRHVTTISQG